MSVFVVLFQVNPPLKGDDTQGNMLLGNLAERLLLGTFFTGTGTGYWYFPIENAWAIHFYLGNLDQSWALCLIWLPVDDKIAQQHCSKSCPLYRHVKINKSVIGRLLFVCKCVFFVQNKLRTRPQD